MTSAQITGDGGLPHPHCSCGPHVIHGDKGLGTIGTSVLPPPSFFLSLTNDNDDNILHKDDNII